MPTFGATQRVSGRGGRPSGRSGGTGSNVEGVADGGISPKRSDDITVINGMGAKGAFGLRTGPTFPQSWEFEVDSNKQKYRGYFTVNGTIPLGLTKDSTGSALGSCRVDLFQSGSNLYLQTTTSDGSGNYSFIVPTNSSKYYVRAYKEGSPNLFGTTDEIITAA